MATEEEPTATQLLFQTCADALSATGFAEAQVTALCTLISENGVHTDSLDAHLGSTVMFADFKDGLNTAFLTSCTALVFVMHAGFAMLCAGSIRSKNTMNILLQTILDAITSAIAFYTVGYGFAYGVGANPNGGIGDSLFAFSQYKGNSAGIAWKDWAFQWAFAATATTIPAGCVAERFNFVAYLAYSFFVPAWIYPIVVHWAWSFNGWMSYWKLSGHLFRAGYVDFAGSGVVHMVGGFCGFWACILVGPRMGRFDSNGKPVDMPGHSATLVVLGTVLLWFGWYGFNPGSIVFIHTAAYAQVAGRAAVTTTLSGSAGGLTALALGFTRHKAWDLIGVCNGVLVGFVSITAGCHVLEPWAALIAGMVGAILFEGICILYLKFKIDDPLCASPMHGWIGIWAVLVTGLLAKKEYIYQVYSGTHVNADGEDDIAGYPYGLFYPGGGGRLFACQVVGVLVIFGWVAFNSIPFFFALKAMNRLRISPEEEQAGLDVSKHGGQAYNYEGGAGNKNGESKGPL